MFKFIKNAIAEAEKDEARRSKDYLISGFREPRVSYEGDEVELENDPDGGWIVYHEDHHIGWIKGIAEKKIDDADEIKLKVKDGQHFVRVVDGE